MIKKILFTLITGLFSSTLATAYQFEVMKFITIGWIQEPLKLLTVVLIMTQNLA